MIITDKEGTVKIPVVTNIENTDQLHLIRDNYDYTLVYSSYNDYFIQVTLSSDIFEGEWIYSIGDNIGIIAVRSSANDCKSYEGSCNIIEFLG